MFNTFTSIEFYDLFHVFVFVLFPFCAFPCCTQFEKPFLLLVLQCYKNKCFCLLVLSLGRVLLRVWWQDTVERQTVRRRPESERRDWQTGLNWPVCCAGDSSPAKRLWSDISSSLSYTGWVMHVTPCLNICKHEPCHFWLLL